MSAHCDVLRRAARGVFGAMAAVAVVCLLPAATDAGTSAPASGSLAYGADAQHLNVQIVNGQASGSTPWNWVDLRINGVMITGLNIGGFPSCQTYPNGSAACGGGNVPPGSQLTGTVTTNAAVQPNAGGTADWSTNEGGARNPFQLTGPASGGTQTCPPGQTGTPPNCMTTTTPPPGTPTTPSSQPNNPVVCGVSESKLARVTKRLIAKGRLGHGVSERGLLALIGRLAVSRVSSAAAGSGKLSPLQGQCAPPPRGSCKVQPGKLIRGTSLDDTLTGTAGSDDINGLDGKDTIYGEGDNDNLHGGPGRDKVVDGGPCDDALTNSGKDVDVKWIGGTGNDTENGQAEEMQGNEGNDYLINGHRGGIINAGGDEDVVVSAEENQKIDCGSGKDILVVLHHFGVKYKNCESVTITG